MEGNINALSENILPELTQTFGRLVEAGSIEVEPCKNNLDLENIKRYSKLQLSSAQKIHMSALLQQVPSIAASGAVAQAYTVKFPKGLPHVLTALQQGGFGTPIRSGGSFVGTASLYPMMAQATVLGAFTAMSVVSGQYFLKQINDQLKDISRTLDEIIKILYAGKRAELLSEISFCKNAYENYCSMMSHEQQRVATIVSLQQSKKAAMKHINFYLEDLSNCLENSNNSESPENIQNAIDLAIQLYVLSSLMEIYYAQNFDTDYLDYIENDLIDYVYKCKNQLQAIFSKLSVLPDGNDSQQKGFRQRVQDTGKKVMVWKKESEKEPVNENKKDETPYKLIADALMDDEGWVVSRKTVEDAFKAFTKSQTYYLSDDGDMYIRI